MVHRAHRAAGEPAMKDIIYQCEECPHMFSYEDVERELTDPRWGHPCFALVKGNLRNPGTHRCESYRACYRLTRITSPITDDSFKGSQP